MSDDEKGVGEARAVQAQEPKRMKYTVSERTLCAVCGERLEPGTQCYKFGNWTGADPHMWQCLRHVDNAKSLDHETRSAPDAPPSQHEKHESRSPDGDGQTSVEALIQDRSLKPHPVGEGPAAEPAQRESAGVVTAPQGDGRLHGSSERKSAAGFESRPTLSNHTALSAPDAPPTEGAYDAEHEAQTLFHGLLKPDEPPLPPFEHVLAFLRLWANSYLLKGNIWDVPHTMGSALNQAIAILEREKTRAEVAEAQIAALRWQPIETAPMLTQVLACWTYDSGEPSYAVACANQAEGWFINGAKTHRPPDYWQPLAPPSAQESAT
jgi:hypothetical protein